jgi:radical SAM superfamily enzyme
MIAEAELLSELPINTIKFHQLQIIRNTFIENEFQKSPEDFVQFSLDGYIDFIISFIEKLNPGFVIERFAGEVPPRFLAVTPWKRIRYDQVLQQIEKRLEDRDSWQGKHYIF